MSSVEIDEDTLRSEILAMSGVQDAVGEVADALADEVRDNTPELTGTAKDSIEVDESEIEGGKRVLSTDFKFHWIEFGTGMRENRYGAERGEMPAFAPFRHAAESFGASFTPADE